MTGKRILIGDAVLTRHRNVLEVGDEQHVIEPLAAELLAYLAANAGGVVSLDDLHSKLWKDRVVTDSSVYRQIAELRRLLGDDVKSPRYIETIRKRGYRLIADVRFDGLDTGSDVAADATGAAEPVGRRWPPVAAMAAAVVAAAAVWWWQSTGSVPADGSGRLTVAVVPFEALGADTPDYMADAVAWALNDRLASIAELRVPAFPTVRSLATDDDSPPAIASKLGADLLVVGNVILERSGGRETLTASATIIDARSSEQLSSVQHEAPGADLHVLREQLAVDVAQLLEVKLLVEPDDGMLGSDPALYSLLMTAHSELDGGFREDTLNAAIEAYTEVLAVDPDSVPALAGRSVAHLRLYNNFYDRSDERVTLARRDAQAAIERAPDSYIALFASGYVESVIGSPRKAQELFRAAVNRRPSSAVAWLGLGTNARRLNRLRESINALAEAVALNPQNAVMRYELGLVETVAGDYRAAEQSFRSALDIDTNFVEVHLYLAFLYVLWLGDSAAFAAELDEAAELIGRDALIQMLLSPGLWGFLTYAGEDYRATAAEWSVAENGGETGAWHLFMGERELLRGNTQAARAHYQTAIDIRLRDVAESPADPWYTAELAVAYAGFGDADAAIAAADRALVLAPPEVDPWINADFLWYRATVLKILGLETEVVAQIRDALRYRALITPLSLREDPTWSRMFENEEFLALITDDGTQWRAWQAAD